MKSILLLLIALHSVNGAIAQWTPQVTVLPAPNAASIAISVVDSSIVWTLSVDLTHFSNAGDPIGPMNRFTRTLNGGALWVQDTIEGAKGLHPGGIAAVDGETAWVTLQDKSLNTIGGIFKTANGEANWIKQGTAFTGPAITLNGGNSWTTVDNNSYGLLSFASPGIGWAVGANNIGSISIFRWSGKALVASIQGVSSELPKNINFSR